ncbi:LPD38 domain-containing protein [Paenibacillus odorifer]|uniref:LPD38 domain-containing protein n=1 Tax=Paenibacillus odorifer TaxID=189426 RepID=UPI00096E0199|nr:LPD38 domain-containing protein [Paenibacillus odorifer]OMD08413.1 hypothetical protein BJP50_07435 [Paenibacillus odorifer]
MSMFDAARNKIRGEEAKQRVLERVYNPKPTEPEEVEDMFSAVRKHLANPSATSQEPATNVAVPEVTVNPITQKVLESTLNSVMNPQVKASAPEPKKKEKKSIGSTLLQAGQDFNAFTDRAKSAATVGLTDLVDQMFTKIGPEEARKAQQESIDRAKNAKGGIVADVAGSLLSFQGAYKLGGEIVGPLIKNAPKLVQQLAKGSAAGAAFEVPRQTSQEIAERFGGEKQSTNQRLANVGISTALGGLTDLGVGVGGIASRGIKNNILSKAVGGAIGVGSLGAGLGAANEFQEAGAGQQQSLGGRLGDVAKYAASGAALGLLGGTALSQLFRKNGVPELLALPEAEARTVRKAQAGQTSVLESGIDPVANPYTFQLDEATPTTQRNALKAAENRAEVKAIDKDISELQTKYEQRVIDEYKVLKEQQAKSGAPKTPIKEIYQQAKRNIDEGFETESGKFPSWKQENNFDQELFTLQQAREAAIQRATKADPALKVTDTPIVEKTLKDTTRIGPKPQQRLQSKPVEMPNGKESKPAPKPEQPKVEAPKAETPKVETVSKADARYNEIQKKVDEGKILPQEDIDYLLSKSHEKQVSATSEIPIKETQKVEELEVPKAEHVPAEKQKQDLHTDLFGEQGLGIVSGGSTRRGSPVSTADQIVSKRIKTDKEGLKEAAKAQLRAVHQNNVDALSPIKKLSQDAYDSAMDSSRANNIANVIINDKFVDMQGNVIGDSLKDIFGKVARGQDKNFLDYLNLKRATTRMEKGQQVFSSKLEMTPAKVAERVKTLEERYPGFKEIADDYYKYWDNILQMAVDEGLITKASKKAMQEAEPYYVPQYRQFSLKEKPGRSVTSATVKPTFSGQKAPIKELNKNGSGRDLIDARKTTMESTGAWTNAILRNRAMQSIVDSVKRAPENYKGIIEIVEPPKSKVNLKDVLTSGGQDDFIENLNVDFKNLFSTSKVDGENIVRGMVNGEPIYLKVHDPEIVKALTTMGPQTSSLLIDGIAAFSNATKRGATGLLAPVFAIKGATMDLAQSAIQAKNPAKQAAYSVYAIMSGIGDSLSIPGLRNWAQEYARAGGGYSYALKGERKLNKSVSEITKYPLLSGKNAAKVAGKALKSPFSVLEEIGNIAENAPRIAASRLELKRSGGEITPKSVRDAMNAGREATVNYSRKGLHSQEIEAIAPYSNAAVQGTRRILVALKNKPVRTAAAIGAIAVAPKLYEYSQFHDDEDYQQIPARERMRNIIVKKNKDGSFVKIPMDPAYASFGEMTIETMRAMKDNDPNAFKGSMDALANAWTPPLLTGLLQGVTKGDGPEGSLAGVANATVFGPASAILSNKSFTGAPIVSGSLEGRSKKYQYDEKTSLVAKKVGEVTGASPIQVDYIIKAYGGDLARLVLPLTSDLGQGNTRNTLLRNFIVDPTFTNTLSEDFYDAKDKLNQVYKDAIDLDKPVPAWYDDEIRKAINSSAKGSVNKQLADLRAYKKVITADKELTSKERTTKIREIQEQINAIYINVNSVLAEQGVIK